MKNFFEGIYQIAQVATPIILFYLAFLKDSHFTNRTSQKERIEKLYVPFYQKYIVGMYSHGITLSGASKNIQDSFVLLFSSNLLYMDTPSQKAFATFYKSYLKLHQSYDEKLDCYSDDAMQHFDASFTLISKSLLSEYRLLCWKLKLPEPLNLIE